MRPGRLLALIALLTGAACGGHLPPARGPGATVEPPPPGTPRLLVFLVVDQLATDTLERVRPLLAADGGLRRLLDEGVHHTAAHHGHAITYTGPGHATLATGHHPAVHGIVANDWFDRERGELVNCVEDDDGEVTPARLLVPTIGDWIKARYPDSRVVAASGKDRGAVLVAGRSGDAVLWYDDETGVFTTSAAAGGTPRWLEAFNRQGLPRELFTGAEWAPLPVDRAAATAAGFVAVDLGPLDHGLPRLLGGYDWLPGERFSEAVYRSPFVDEHLARLATVLLAEESLGADQWPDLLALSFSALDSVGHAWGPGSLEVLDVLLRLDRLLGDFFARLDRQVGPTGWVAGLSSDHGVMPLPEVSRSGGQRRASLPEVRCLRRAVAAVAERFGDGVWLADDGYLDRRFLARRGLDPRTVEAFAEAALAACPGVDEVWTRHEIATLPTGDTPSPGSAGWLPALYRNAFHAERSPDLFLQSEPDFLPAAGAHTTHASPHPHDTAVPIVFRAPTLTPGTAAAPVLTVDFAPTLAGLIAVPVPEGVVGRPLPATGPARGGAGGG